jgi:hypothetical protein
MPYNCCKHHKAIDSAINSAGIKFDIHIQKKSELRSFEFIAVTCLFKLEHSYRNINIYINTLHETCRTNNNNPIIIRIYYNKNIEDEIKNFEKYKNVELIRYDIPQLNGGTCGTLMRYLSIFDFSYGANICHGFDADMLLDYREIKRCISVMNKFNTPYYCLFNDNDNMENSKRKVLNNFPEIAMATYIANTQILKLSQNIIINFFLDIINRESNLVAWAEKNTERTNTKFSTLCKYGIDEYFLQLHIIPAIYEKHNIIGTRLYGSVRNIHYDLYKAINDNKFNLSKYPTLINDLNKIFKNIISKTTSLQDIITKIDKAIIDKLLIFRSINNNICVLIDYLALLIKIKNSGAMKFSPNIEKLIIYNENVKLINNKYILHEPTAGGSEIKILIIIPYGDLRPEQKRSEQLAKFIEYFKKINNKLPILITEQANNGTKFNKGLLYNIAIDWAKKNIKPTRIIFHDVDMLPDKELYSQYINPDLKTPILLTPPSKTFIEKYSNLRLPVGGGVTMIDLGDLLKINGYPNNCWGWGYEDNMFQKRLTTNKIWYHYNDIGDFTDVDVTRKSDLDKWKYLDDNNLKSNITKESMLYDVTNWMNNGINQLSQLNYEMKVLKPKDNIYHIVSYLHDDEQKKGASKVKILIVVPFGDLKPEEKRTDQLNAFIKHMTDLITKEHNESVCIVIADQIDPLSYFNRGQLLNAGVKWYVDNNSAPEYVILHDVDMLPNRVLFNEYLNISGSTSLVPVNSAEYKASYGKVIINAGGAIFGLSYSDYVEANGYPNTFWSWGGEDDAFGKRLKLIKKDTYSRVKKGNITSTDIQRKKSHQSKMEYLRKNKIRSMMVHENLAEDNKSWQTNGYNNVSAEVAEIQRYDKICGYHVKFRLNQAMLQETIDHNTKVYQELGI